MPAQRHAGGHQADQHVPPTITPAAIAGQQPWTNSPIGKPAIDTLSQTKPVVFSPHIGDGRGLLPAELAAHDGSRDLVIARPAPRKNRSAFCSRFSCRSATLDRC